MRTADFVSANFNFVMVGLGPARCGLANCRSVDLGNCRQEVGGKDGLLAFQITPATFLNRAGYAGGSISRAGWSIMSKTTNKFCPEVRDLAVQMVLGNQGQHKSRRQAILSISPKIG